jgi:hypothetical protein
MPPSPVLCIRANPKRQAIIDEFGECDRQVRLWKPQTNPHRARFDELEAEILSWAADDAPDKSTLLSGSSYQVEISARGFKSEFGRGAQLKAYTLLKKIKGLDLMQFFTVTLAEAKFHLGGAFVKDNVPKLQTGPRAVNVVPRVEAKPGKGKAA